MKVIELADEIFGALVDFLERMEDRDLPVREWMLARALKATIEPQGKRDRSVLEWHTYPNEKPEDEWVIICVEGYFATVLGDQLDMFAEDLGGSVRWADRPVAVGVSARRDEDAAH